MAFLEHRIPPPLVAGLCAALMWLTAGSGPELPLRGLARHGVTGGLVLTGLMFDLLGLLAFRAARTTLNPLRPERVSVLVTSGVYRVTRNPMYVGMLCLLLAWAVHLGTWLACAGPVGFVLFLTRFQIVPEERVLVRTFGAQYTAYASRVRRWL
ncbi:MAG: isoprenylcysteine carboxylmethyltransferase family protein [Gammaproteobacteria bacterium]